MIRVQIFDVCGGNEAFALAIVDGFLFGISVYDPLTLVSIVPVLGGVTLIACATPAWRAARVNLAIALRSE